MNKGLIFKPMNPASLEIALFIDAGFATNNNMTSQLGFIMVLMDKDMNANIIHYGSVKSKRVTRSVLAAEIFAMVQGFDVSSTMCLALNDMFGNLIPFKIYTDSRSLFDCLTNINCTI